MSDGLKTLLKRCGITAAAGLALGFALFSSRGGFQAENTADILSLLCDAFTVPGVLCLCAGGLVFASNGGVFNSLGFIAAMPLSRILPGMASRKHERYSDYLQRKKEKGPVKGYSFLVWTGLGFLLVAAILLAAFYAVS